MYSPNTLSYSSSIPSTIGGITAARCIIEACYSVCLFLTLMFKLIFGKKATEINQHVVKCFFSWWFLVSQFGYANMLANWFLVVWKQLALMICSHKSPSLHRWFLKNHRCHLAYIALDAEDLATAKLDGSHLGAHWFWVSTSAMNLLTLREGYVFKSSKWFETGDRYVGVWKISRMWMLVMDSRIYDWIHPPGN